MLVNVSFSRKGHINDVLTMMAAMDGKSTEPKLIRQGAYLIPHFNFEHMSSEKLDRYPDLEFIKAKSSDEEDVYGLSCYGVCDTPYDFFERFGDDLEKSDRKFVVSFTEIKRLDQPAEGGWRWHKWGPYYGAHEPQYEYLHDEKGIDAVHCFHVYEVLT